jgi:glutamate/tyrosine decarboxylase-like PLP-dependent enzyme
MNPEHLSWFLGPKAENAEDFERLLLLVFRDYVHWRRNYFPGDSLLLNESMRREYVNRRDELDEQTQRLLALLRRNFPFYSPRYLAHELSDTLIPAALGFFAGLLYNPNNVTPEAAPVTVDLEVEACSSLLRMLGFRPPPVPPSGDVDLDSFYAEESAKGFAWAHLTPGGTLSNIEAMWVARDVKYFPFAVRDIAKKRRLPIEVKLPRKDSPLCRIVDLDDHQIASLRPNECIYLLAKFVDELRRNETEPSDPWQVLRNSEFSTSRGIHASTRLAPPVVLVASTAHYSVKKAAQVLGLGRDSVWGVPVNGHFRLDTNALRESILRARAQGLNPFCVIGTAGSTEEGSVDPLHEIVDLRTELEEQHDFSFWLHVDAAWGGFIRTLFCPEDRAQACAVMKKVSNILGIDQPGNDLVAWHKQLVSFVETVVASAALAPSASKVTPVVSDDTDSSASRAALETESTQSPSPMDSARETESASSRPEERMPDRARKVLDKMELLLRQNAFDRYTELLETLPNQFGHRVELGIDRSALTWTFDDLHRDLTDYVSSAFTLQLDRHQKDYLLSWPARDVCAAFLKINAADSVTLDPHKMGYVPYPAGAVAFKNDRIRHFVRQDAPYITAKNQSVLVHRPPVHRTGGRGPEGIHRDAFGPFILDGSRPGAAASGVWLATRAVPLTRCGHGSIVRASVLAVKALYEWLSQWANMHLKIEKDIDYEFIPLTDRGPDTNLVTFTVKKRTAMGLREMNQLTEAVYREFTIESELGETEYSYSQPFFLSRTVHVTSVYSDDELQPFASRAKLASKWRQEYSEVGLTVLRATVMNPYLTPLRELGRDDLIRTFVEGLARASAVEVRRIE